MIYGVYIPFQIVLFIIKEKNNINKNDNKYIYI